MSDIQDQPYVNLDNARTDEQRGIMEAIRDHGVCPFCPENLAIYHKEPILREGTHWVITKNQWPYNYTKSHLLAITRYHAEDFTDLHEGALDELQGHVNWAIREFGIHLGGVALRFGDTENNGASVRHLHAHIIEPDPERKPDEKVRFKIS